MSDNLTGSPVKLQAFCHMALFGIFRRFTALCMRLCGVTLKLKNNRNLEIVPKRHEIVRLVKWFGTTFDK